jgi:chemotaxis protein CheD
LTNNDFDSLLVRIGWLSLEYVNRLSSRQAVWNLAIAVFRYEGLWMKSEVFGVPRILHVVQGQVAVSADPNVTYTTILGACIAVCLFDPDKRLGGVAHFLFPHGELHSQHELRFCNHAISDLMARVEEMGGNLNRLQASLFGGAKSHDGRRNIGKRNAESALSFLASHDLAVVKRALGGEQLRRIRFSPTTGYCIERSLSDGWLYDASGSFKEGEHYS